MKLKSIFLTDATDFAREFNKAVNETMSPKDYTQIGENSGLKELRQEVTAGGASLVRLMITVGLIVATLSLIIAGLKIASQNRYKRQEGKDKLVAVMVGAGIITGMGAIVLIIQNIAETFMK